VESAGKEAVEPEGEPESGEPRAPQMTGSSETFLCEKENGAKEEKTAADVGGMPQGGTSSPGGKVEKAAYLSELGKQHAPQTAVPEVEKAAYLAELGKQHAPQTAEKAAKEEAEEEAARTGWMKELSNATINEKEWSGTPATGGGLPNTANNEKDYSTLDLIWTPPTKRALKVGRKWVAALEAIEASVGPWYI